MKDLLHNLSEPVVFICRIVPHIPGVQRHHVHITVGTAVAIGGVVLSKCITAPFAAHILADFTGYTLHAIGLAPLLKHLHLD